jgi:tetratricopeptide (TPR) repeat protein
MKLAARVVVPILSAIILVTLLVGFLLWQLSQSSARVQQQLAAAERRQDIAVEGSAPQDDSIDAGDEALFHLRQGDLLGLQGSWTDAETEYQASVKAGGGLPALRKLAGAQLQRRQYDALQATIRRMRGVGARSEDLLLLESLLQLRKGELTKAKQLLTTSGDTPQKHYGLALLAIIQDDHATAKTELTSVVNGWEPVLRSYARTLQGAYEEFAAFPDSSDIHLTALLAHALAEVQECDLALPLLHDVLVRQDDYRDAWLTQGYCELSTERFKEALTSFDRAYTIDPEKPETQYFLGRTHMALKDYRNAITFFQYALLNGFTPDKMVRRELARAAAEAGDTALALNQYRSLAEAEDADLGVTEKFVLLAIALDQKNDAYLFAKRAVEKWKEEAKSHELLGTAAAALEKKDEARTELQRALSIDPTLTSAKEQLKKL